MGHTLVCYTEGKNCYRTWTFLALHPAGSTAPERLETGTLSHEAIAGSAGAVNFLASLTPIEPRRAALKATYQELHERGQHLFAQLWDGLQSISRCHVLWTSTLRCTYSYGQFHNSGINV